MCKICDKTYDENTTLLFCCKDLKEIPDTLVNLKELFIGSNTYITKIPITLVNLNVLCSSSFVKFIPDTLKKLVQLVCPSGAFISPKTFKNNNYIRNNNNYLIFVKCQKNYKIKLLFRKIKFACHPDYLIGSITKKQLTKMFNFK